MLDNSLIKSLNMKHLFLFILVVFAGNNLYSQHAKIQKDTSYLDDYSNYKKDYSKTPIVKSYKSFKIESYNAVVVVNGKIFDPKSTEFRSIPTENLYLEKTYKDTASTSEIKYIYIFRQLKYLTELKAP